MSPPRYPSPSDRATLLDLCGYGSIIISGDERRLAKSPVEPGVDNMLVFANVDIAQREGAKRERNANRAEAVVVILDKARQIKGNAIFKTRAVGPTAARLVPGREPEGTLNNVLVAFPGAAGLHVAEQPIPGIADAAGHRRQRSRSRAISRPDEERVRMGAHCIGPVKVCLGTEHPAGGLIVAAALDTAEEGVCIM